MTVAGHNSAKEVGQYSLKTIGNGLLIKKGGCKRNSLKRACVQSIINQITLNPTRATKATVVVEWSTDH